MSQQTSLERRRFFSTPDLRGARSVVTPDNGNQVIRSRSVLQQEIQAAPIRFTGDEQRYFEALCSHYSKELRAFLPIVSEKVRRKNIRKVNERQAALLQEKGLGDVQINKKARELLLYYRTGSDGRTQMDPFEFVVITWILNWYIQTGRSQVFNRLGIVSRLENNYPHEVHAFSPKIMYHNVRGEEFKRTCSIGANTIHLTHGTSTENEYASVPILGQSSREDSVVMKSCPDFVPLQLYYPEGQRPHNRDIQLGEEDHSGSFRTIMSETIRAVRSLEERMLRDAEPNERL